jgi:small subunit ribosomal protein S1
MAVNTLPKPTPEEALAALDESEYSEAEFNEMMELYEETLETIKQGEIVMGTVRSIHDGIVVVDIGFKSEGAIPLSEFGDPPAIEEGDEIEVFLESIEDQEGQVVLSKTKADFMRVWDRIKDAYDSDQIVEGRLMRRIKGGIVVDLFGVDAFLPGSQIDIKQVKNFDQFLGNVYPFRIIKLNKNRRNIVISRRVVLEEERSRLRKQILATLEVGQVRQGSVKNITDFGAFIDLGGLDGLLHITDIAWGRVGHPSEVLSIGEEVEVKVLNYDEKRERISLGMKQLQDHPWKGVEEKYPVDSKVIGKVVSITDYGAFVELEQGVEGLVHISEMSWTQHIRHPSKLVSISDEVEVMVLRVDQEGQKNFFGSQAGAARSLGRSRPKISLRDISSRHCAQFDQFWGLCRNRRGDRRAGAYFRHVLDQAHSPSKRSNKKGPGIGYCRAQYRQRAAAHLVGAQTDH